MHYKYTAIGWYFAMHSTIFFYIIFYKIAESLTNNDFRKKKKFNTKPLFSYICDTIQ